MPPMNGHEVKMLNLATLQPHGKAAALRDMVQSRRETQADKIRAWELFVDSCTRPDTGDIASERVDTDFRMQAYACLFDATFSFDINRALAHLCRVG